MSDFRRFLESLDTIAEAGPKGLPTKPWELTPLEGGGGGGGAIGGPTTSGGISAGRLPPLRVPSVGKSGIGQGVGSAKPKIERLPGETPAQAVARAQAQAARPLPPGVTPSTAGAGRGTVNPELPKTGVLRQNPARAELQAQQAQQNLMKSSPGSRPAQPPVDKATKKDIAKSVAGHAALGAAALYGASKKKPGEEGGASSATPSTSPTVIPVDLTRPDSNDTDTASKPSSTTSTSVDLPTVGPQGPNSPFVVVEPDANPTIRVPDSQPQPQAQPPKTQTQPQSQTQPTKPTSTSTSTGTADNTTTSQPTAAGKTGAGSSTSGQPSLSTGTGSSAGQKQTADDGSPFPMMRQQLGNMGKQNESKSLKRLVKEFKRFVNRKI